MDNYIVDLYNFLAQRFPDGFVPKAFGTFHIVSFALVVVASVLMCVFFRNCSDRTMRIILTVAWVIMFGLEVLEQMVIGTKVLDDGTLFFDYHWYRFPFQLCSTALWIVPFIILIPEGKIRDGLIGYMTLFSFIGGLLVMITVGDVMTNHIITCVHTMVHHGIQVILGVFFISHERHKYNLRYFFGGVLTFLGLLAIAALMNEVGHELFLAYGREDVAFNMFYISPYYGCHLPVLSIFYGTPESAIVPYPVFLAIYCFGFILLAFIVYFVASFINYVVDYIRHKEKYIRN